MSFWIKYESSLPTKPEVVELAAILGMSRFEVVGRLMAVWAWANEQTHTGHARSVTEAFLDELHGAPGFAKAMQKVGWLRVTDAGISIPHFDRHMSQSAKRRALTAARVKRCRNAQVTLKCAPEKRREDKSIKTPPTPRSKTSSKQPKPEQVTSETAWDLACAAMKGATLLPQPFEEAWAAWVAWCLADPTRKSGYTTHALRSQIRTLEKMGYDDAITALENATGRWQGVFTPSGRGPGAAAPASEARPAAPPGKYVGVTGVVCDPVDVEGGQDGQG